MNVNVTRNDLESGFFEIEHVKLTWTKPYSLVLEQVTWGSHPRPGVKTFLRKRIWRQWL